MCNSLTQARLKDVLIYCPESGGFTWRVTLGSRAKEGEDAGTICTGSYKKIMVDKQRFYAHRLAFLYMTGEWPEHDVDHINGIRTDNRWVNLRPATRAENMENLRRGHADSRSGMLGVYPSGSKFRAIITVRGERVLLGSFITAEAAHAAYLNAKRELHGGCTI